MAYRFESQEDGFLLVHEGLISLSEIEEINGRVQGHNNFYSHKYQLIDLLNADFSQIDQQAAKQPATTDWVVSLTRAAVKVALVANNDLAVKFCQGYITESQALESSWEFKLFSNLEDAKNWIGI